MTIQLWGAASITLACLALAIPVVVVHVGGGQLPVIGTGWWLALFGLYFTAFSATMWLFDLAPPRVRAATAVSQAVLGPVLVLTAPQAGWTQILLVFNAAVLAYLWPWRMLVALIGMNTAVVGVGAVTVESTVFEIVMVSLLYCVLQAASVFAVKEHLRESELRKRIAEDHVRLRAASTLLARSSRAEERLRIARELHDLVGHQLTVLSLELEIASHKVGDESVDRARGLTKQLLGDVRAAVGEMRQEGRALRETLEGVVADLPEPAVHLWIDDEVEAGEECATALVRCVQEIVTNAIRHAEAENVWIEISAAEDLLRFDARDDGAGARSFEPGNGLRGMTERLEALGGTVAFSGGHGFRVRAEVPAA